LALKKTGKVVGYLGDGVNDAPALRAADVGISVNNAVDVTKETADILLLRKSLNVLKEGVIEGRKTFLNARKYIMMGLSSNFGDMFSMTAGSSFLPFLPMQPTQIILDNLVYDSSQLALTTDKVEEEDLKKTAYWDISFIARFMVFFGLLSSVFDMIGFVVLYFVFHFSASLFQTGWFLISVTSEVFVIFVIRTRKIPFLQSRPSLLLILNTSIVVLIAWLIPFTPLASFFSFAPLGANILLICAAIAFGHLLTTELLKRVFYKIYKKY
jgi:Mg2+-importing ATPase